MGFLRENLRGFIYGLDNRMNFSCLDHFRFTIFIFETINSRDFTSSFFHSCESYQSSEVVRLRSEYSDLTDAVSQSLMTLSNNENKIEISKLC
ncbi:hypothetical protein D6810_01605 [Candidatus Dojkabacteria bacterium]|uniref:Uncharacterized protein n=1 Tax=Candidatus Dojkabacteria bacterium TaxID=2099670 RepID=A0A3M0Z2M6_9BACT|nr:MAG: hypothetical protein D6810_01605 [Candidatus Dojkabacteria bacterium]